METDEPMLRPALGAAAALLMLGCAPTQSAESVDNVRDCFRTVDVSGYSPVDEHRIKVTVSPQREYYLTIQQNVRDLDWAHAIALRSTTSFICTGNGLGVQVLGGDPVFPYPVTDIERVPVTAIEGS